MSKNTALFSIGTAAVALAAGVAIGAFAIPAASSDAGSTSSTAATEQLQVELDRSQDMLTLLDRFDRDHGATLVRDSLVDRPVLLITGPGVPDAQITSVSNLLDDSGATTAGRIALTEKFVNPDASDELKNIVTGLLPAGAQLSQSLNPGTQAGEVMGSALLLSPDAAEPQATEEERSDVLTSLAAADFISYEAGTVRPGQLVLVILGPSDNGTSPSGLSEQLVSDFVSALDGRGSGVVVAGPTSTARAGDVIDMLRASEAQLSTVDYVEHPAGQITAVLALLGELEGQSNAYGYAASAQQVTRIR